MTKSKPVKEVKSAIIPDGQLAEPKNETSPNTEAVVYDGKFEVRRYNVSTHGVDFIDLAKDFASKKNYSVKLEEAKVGIKCPSCGHIFIA